ncbi:succinate dehydrogenase, cytochrome b556 subunit [Candidatus Blochmanniella vafra str. BVAF]|uniref:Succinate dehydrogenase cytochrome b556 subunit n=1 Tax=Blochmanniella vafra (strain BVAF) TaxID=859654 RepID=E8Q6X6_BLOVB|nr:succinate dehydrogenase, cytochrome b556 subunit [Candidatus Blochmannia vafer]ADV33723.1 succinate dehydrogenase, cytochrome b556 subunit [Candidatus Blochmannia vafer str. BVAF]
MLNNNLKFIQLDIKTIKFPITAIASILHRISGIFLFIMIGPILWVLRKSLHSEDNFYKISNLLLINNYLFLFVKWSVTIALSYHIIFGIRQMLMDFGFLKQTLLVGKISAIIVFILVISLFIYIELFL